MRIAVVSPYALDRPGGVQTQCRQLVAGLSDQGQDVWLIGPGHSGPEGSRLLGSSVGVPANKSVAPIGLDPRMAGRLKAAIAGADVAHVHEPLTPLVGWAALRLEVPIVGTFHADPPGWVRFAYQAGRPFFQAALRRLVAATAVSSVAAEPVAGLAGAVEVIPNGVRTSDFSPADRSGNRVAFLGRDEPRKGLDVILQAWPRVLAALPEAELVVLGATRPPLPGVSFLGPVDSEQKRAELGAADVLCAPNLGGESFGIVLVEGMASGCAVVASGLPGFRDTVGDAGVFVPPGDMQSLADAVIRILSADYERLRLQKAAEARARDFDWSVVLPAYEAVYERALSQA